VWRAWSGMRRRVGAGTGRNGGGAGGHEVMTSAVWRTGEGGY